MSVADYGRLTIKETYLERSNLSSSTNATPTDGDIWYEEGKVRFRQAGTTHVVGPVSDIIPYEDTNETLGTSYNHIVTKDVNIKSSNIKAVSLSNLDVDVEYSYDINKKHIFIATLASGNSSNLYMSTNGSSWSLFPYTSGEDMSLNAYGSDWDGEIFVTVGEGASNTIVYHTRYGNFEGLGNSIFSTKGLTVRYGNSFGRGIWVAGGEGTNTLAYSYDGVNWTGNGTSIFSTRCNSIKFNGGRWVACGAGTNSLAYSDDGIVWTGVGTSIFTEGRDSTWTGMEWIAVGNGTSHTIASSPDATSWTGNGKTIFTTEGYAIDWNGDMWVAVGQGTNHIAFSRGAIVTGLGTTVFNTRGRAVKWVGNKWIVGGDDTGGSNNSIAISLNGELWRVTESSLSEVTSFSYTNRGQFKVLFPRSRMVACGTGTPNIAISYDEGISWALLNDTIFTTARGIYMDGAKFVAAGTGSNDSLAYSPDFGTTWHGLGKLVFSTAGYAVTKGGNVWVAVGEGTNTIAYSYDGYNWNGLGTSIFSTRGYAVAWNGSQFLAGGTGTNPMAYSSDGVNWTATQVASDNFTEVRCLVWGNNRWIIGGTGQATKHYAFSHNAVNWDTIASGMGTIEPEGLAWNGESFIAVDAATVYTSRDGERWVLADTVASHSFFAAVWNGERWLVGGDNGASAGRLVRGSNINDFSIAATGSFPATKVEFLAWNNSNIGVVRNEGYIVYNQPSQSTYQSHLFQAFERYLFEGIISSWTDNNINTITTSTNFVSWDGNYWYFGGDQGYLHRSEYLDTWDNAITSTQFNTLGVGATPNVNHLDGDGTKTVIAIQGSAASDSLLLANKKGENPVTTTGHTFNSYARVVKHNGTRWLAGGDRSSGSGVQYSMAYSALSSGSSWTSVDNSIFTEVRDLLYINGRWFACGVPDTSNSPIAISDDDGATWTQLSNASVTTVFDANVNSMSCNGTRLILSSTGTNKVGYIDNIYTAAASVTATAGTGVAADAYGTSWNGKYFYTVGGTIPYLSYDGAAWHDARLTKVTQGPAGGDGTRIVSAMPSESNSNSYSRLLRKNDTITVHGNLYGDLKHSNKFSIYFELESA